MHVIKVGGNELDEPGFPHELASTIKALAESVVVVHGGGRAVTELQTKLGIETRKVDGLRVTDIESRRVATMVLCGLANKNLVVAFHRAGLDAMGMCGADAGLVRASKKCHDEDLGFVGEVAFVRTDFVSEMLARGLTLIVAPICLGVDGELYNVNADEVATAMAIACKARALSFVTNVPGVKRNDTILPRISAREVQTLEQTGVVQGGMVPKVRAARDAAQKGVDRVRIVDLQGLSTGAGTLVVASNSIAPMARPAE